MDRVQTIADMLDMDRTDVKPLIDSMAVNAEDRKVLLNEGEFESLHRETAPHYGWVAFVPSIGRAVAVYNGEPVWFDADSLEQAVELGESDADLTE